MPRLGIIGLALIMTFAIANESLATPPKGRHVKLLKPLSVRSKPISLPALNHLLTRAELQHRIETIEVPLSKRAYIITCYVDLVPPIPEQEFRPGRLIFRGNDIPHSFRMEDMRWWMR